MFLFKNQLKSQLRKAHSRIDACENLALNIGDSDNLRLRWLKEDFKEAGSSLQKIDIEIVEAFRRQGNATDDVLDKHVSRAADKFQNATTGVFTCIDQLNRDFSEKRDTAAVLNLDKIWKQARKTLRILHLITRPWRAFLLSWRCLLLMISCGLIATCLLYVSHYALHPRGPTRSQSVTSGVASDVKKIQEAAHDPDAGFIDRGLKTVTTIVDVLPRVPQAILAIIAALAIVQRGVAKFMKPSKRK